jgi:hypothetical protein
VSLAEKIRYLEPDVAPIAEIRLPDFLRRAMGPPEPPRARVCVVAPAPSCRAILSAWGDEFDGIEFLWPAPYNRGLRIALLRYKKALTIQMLWGTVVYRRGRPEPPQNFTAHHYPVSA